MLHALFPEITVTVPIGIFLLSIILYAIKELVKYAQVLWSKRAQQTNLAILKDTPSITSLTEGGESPHVLFQPIGPVSPTTTKGESKSSGGDSVSVLGTNGPINSNTSINIKNNSQQAARPDPRKVKDNQESLNRLQLTSFIGKTQATNLYRVVTDFRVLNERLVRVNHAFPIVRDCLEAIGASKCEVMSVLDLQDAYHTQPLAEESQKYCRITPYYGCPTYIYLHMGMGMSCSPALWQQFVHIIWEELPNKERNKIIMDDILIFSTKEQHWEDLDNLFKVLVKCGLKISPHKCQLFHNELVYMGL